MGYHCCINAIYYYYKKKTYLYKRVDITCVPLKKYTVSYMVYIWTLGPPKIILHPLVKFQYQWCFPSPPSLSHTPAFSGSQVSVVPKYQSNHSRNGYNKRDISYPCKYTFSLLSVTLKVHWKSTRPRIPPILSLQPTLPHWPPSKTRTPNIMVVDRGVLYDQIIRPPPIQYGSLRSFRICFKLPPLSLSWYLSS